MPEYRSPAENANPQTGPERIDYKDLDYLSKHLNPQGQIFSRRRTSFSTKRQRLLKQAVKRARHLALVPFVG